MQLRLIDVLGFAAGALTTISFVPQVVQSWKSRNLDGVSLRMYVLFTVGVGFWLLYGFAVGSWPIAVTNGVTMVLSGAVLILKLIHRDESSR